MKTKAFMLLTFILLMALMVISCININQAVNPESGQLDIAGEREGEELSEIQNEADTRNNTTNEEYEASADCLSDHITVYSPSPDQIITSPLTIEGKARGTWFFEASFPVRLLDAEGNIIAEHYAGTEEEWMTEEFISFYSRLEFEAPETDTGTLILIKDNPSDIAEYDAQLEIPIRFR